MQIAMNVNTVALTDYQMRSPTLAKVMVSFTGKQNKDTIHAAIAEKFDGLAAPVEGSFRIVADNVAVGFLRANQEVRVLDEKKINASYKLVSSNIFMSKEDKSLWTKQEGRAGSYLTRQGQEDLSALVASVKHNRTDVPALRHLAIAKAAKSELLAYVDANGSMDYGFAVASDAAKVKVVSFYSRHSKVVDYNDVVSIVPVQVNRELKAKVQAALTPKEKSDAVAYWRQLYSFAPDYLREVIQQVEEDAVA